MFNWVHAEGDVPAIGDGISGDFIVVRFQVDF